MDAPLLSNPRMCNLVDTPELAEVALSRALMRALLETGDGRHADAERTLWPMIATEQEMRQCILFGSVRLLLAHLYLESNRLRDALSELAPVLEEHERTGSPGLIL